MSEAPSHWISMGASCEGWWWHNGPLPEKRQGASLLLQYLVWLRGSRSSGLQDERHLFSEIFCQMDMLALYLGLLHARPSAVVLFVAEVVSILFQWELSEHR